MRSSARRGVTFVTCIAMIAAAMSVPGGPGSARAQDSAGGEDIADACFGAAERAQPLLRQKKLREARAVLEICARDGCPRVARSDCREWLAEAADAQPSIVIAGHEVRGAGTEHDLRDVRGLRAVIDDTLFVDRVDSTPIVIDPGRHRLRLERAGADAIVQDIDVREGEKARVVDVYWHVAGTVSPTRPVPAGVYVTGAIGIAATVVGASFEIAGLSQRDSLDSTCKPTATCSQGQVDSARAQLRVGDVALGGGVLFLLGTAVLYFTRPAAVATDAPAQSHSSAWIGTTPGGLMAGAQGTL
jgi:hypothetical protein